MTKLLDQHPGGPQVISEVTAKDANAQFDEFCDAPRCLAAERILQQFLVVEDQGHVVAANVEIVLQLQYHNGGMGILVAVIGVIAAAAFYFMHANDLIKNNGTFSSSFNNSMIRIPKI